MELSFLLFKKIVSMALIMMMGYAIRKSGIAKEEQTPIISALLLCVLAVIVEPVLHAWENRQLIVQVPQIEDASTGTALLSAKLALRELVRLILFVSGVLSFLSMGSFWGKYANKAEQ